MMKILMGLPNIIQVKAVTSINTVYPKLILNPLYLVDISQVQISLSYNDYNYKQQQQQQRIKNNNNKKLDRV